MLQIRTQLEEAADTMPGGWWSIPGLAEEDAGVEASDDSGLFGAMMKLRAQMSHFHLVLLTGLPCMLQAACAEATTNEHRHHRLLGCSGRNIATEASRDLLHRFVTLRCCQRTASYFRVLDSYAWHAAATLLLALLLDRVQTTADTSRGHLDHSDRALASKAMENMQHAEEEVGGVEDAADDKDVLLRLLALEASGAAVTVTYRKPGGASVGNSNSNSYAVSVQGVNATLVLSMPFVGLVVITPQVQNGRALDEVILSEAAPDDSDEEDDLMKAMSLRRSAKWALPHYMLRPA